MVTHDINSAKIVAYRIGMIYKGTLIFLGSVEDLDKTLNPYVLQFINGSPDGPITDEYNSTVAGIIKESRGKEKKSRR